MLKVIFDELAPRGRFAGDFNDAGKYAGASIQRELGGRAALPARRASIGLMTDMRLRAVCGAALLALAPTGCKYGQWKTAADIEERCVAQLEDEFVFYVRRGMATHARQAKYQDLVSACCPKMEASAAKLDRVQRNYLWYEMSGNMRMTSQPDALNRNRAEAARLGGKLDTAERTEALGVRTAVFASCRRDFDAQYSQRG